MCGHRKGFFSLLFFLIERWKNTHDQNGYDGAILKKTFRRFLMMVQYLRKHFEGF